MSASYEVFREVINDFLEEIAYLRGEKNVLRNGLQSVSVVQRGVNASIASLMEVDQIIAIADLFDFIGKNMEHVFNNYENKPKLLMFVRAVSHKIPQLIKELKSTNLYGGDNNFKKRAIHSLKNTKAIVSKILDKQIIQQPTIHNIEPSDMNELLQHLYNFNATRKVSITPEL